MAERASGIDRRALLAAGAGLALGVGPLGRAAAPMSKIEIVDIHPHIQSTDLKRYPVSTADAEPGDAERGQTFEQLRAEMDAAGVAKAAVVQVSGYYAFDDSYLVDSIARDRKRFTGVCSIDVLAPNAVRTLQGWLGRGATGLRIWTGGHATTDTAVLDDPRTYPVWEYVEAHRVPVCVQTSPGGLPKVHALARRFPRAVMILDHTARPSLEDGPPYAAARSLFEVAALPGVSLKITSRTFAWSRAGKSTPETFFPMLVKAFGADRLAWGSNLPMDKGPMTRLVGEAMACLASLSREDRAMVMGGTAKRLYPALA